MGSVSSPFFCKSFQLSKDYKEITNCVCIVQNTDTDVAYDQVFYFEILGYKPFVCGTVLKCQ